jgi:chemotaxis protein CheC
MNPTALQLDALSELINIGVGRSADVLNTMLNSHIDLQVPFVKILLSDDFRKELEALGADSLSAVHLSFKGTFSGTTQLIFPAATASKLVTTVTGEEVMSESLDEIRSGTLCEIGNIVLNGLMGSISNVLKMHLQYSVPTYLEGKIENLTSAIGNMASDTKILLARTHFTIKELKIEGDIIVFFETGALDALLIEIGTLNI